jgi:hypothetical protein
MSCINIIVYERSSGEIKGRFGVSAGMADAQCLSDSENWMLGTADDITEYIEVDQNGIPTITPRPEMSLTLDKQTIAADAEDMATISGIPAGATVTSSENSAVVDSGSLEFVTDQVGTHTLKFEFFPYLDAEVTINAV